jgi:hypothetical protein
MSASIEKVVEIVERSIDVLVPYPYNPLIHNKHQIEAIAESIKFYGFNSPIIIDESNNIIAGHGRFFAAKHIGLSVLPCVEARHLSSAQVRAYRIADNKLASTDWDFELLSKELEAITDELDILPQSLGFSDDEVANLLSEVEDDEDDEIAGELLQKLDLALEEPKVKVSEGEHWKLGNHYLIIVSVLRDYEQWIPYLEAERIFAPYPGAHASLAKEPLVMVQPDLYVAGHLIDVYNAVNSDEQAIKIK